MQDVLNKICKLDPAWKDLVPNQVAEIVASSGIGAVLGTLDVDEQGNAISTSPLEQLTQSFCASTVNNAKPDVKGSDDKLLRFVPVVVGETVIAPAVASSDAAQSGAKPAPAFSSDSAQSSEAPALASNSNSLGNAVWGMWQRAAAAAGLQIKETDPARSGSSDSEGDAEDTKEATAAAEIDTSEASPAPMRASASLPDLKLELETLEFVEAASAPAPEIALQPVPDFPPEAEPMMVSREEGVEGGQEDKTADADLDEDEKVISRANDVGLGSDLNALRAFLLERPSRLRDQWRKVVEKP